MKNLFKNLYICSSISEDGEYEGVFNEDGKLIDAWSLDDASFSEEYFNDFLETVGVSVSRIEEGDPEYKKFCRAINKHFED